MKFEDYKKSHLCSLLHQTEQSQTFTINVNGEKRVIKKYPNEFDRLKEELAYRYVKSFDLLKVPELISNGEDFVEMEFLDSIGTPSIEEVIKDISNMYLGSDGLEAEEYFPRIDLSKDKIYKRLLYIPNELEKRGFLEKGLVNSIERFTNEYYSYSESGCLVHGDLKMPHIIKTKKGIFFIDLALTSIANPWYDLAFLYMEKRERDRFRQLVDSSFNIISREFKVNKNETEVFLTSSIFYRSLYDVIFASRHRSDKVLARTIKDLKEILK